MPKSVVASFREFLKEGGGFSESSAQPLHKNGDRHIDGMVSRNGGMYFVELEAKPGDSWAAPSLLRKISWGINVPKREYSFGTPEIVEHGLWHNRHYVISEKVDGAPLLAKCSDDPTPCVTHMDKLVAIALNLLNLSPEDFSRIPENGSGRADELIAGTEWWFDEITGNERFADLMTAVEQGIPGCYVPWPSHGAFAPWRILISRDSWYLIGAEHAGFTKPKWYDVVYFAHRLATQCNGLNQAIEFLGAFRKALPNNIFSHFNQTLYPLMASLIIGGIRETQKNATNLQPHLHLAQAWRDRAL